MVDLYETAVEELYTWDYEGNKKVRPKVIASTVTSRRARQQVRGVFARDVQIFPPRIGGGRQLLLEAAARDAGKARAPLHRGLRTRTIAARRADPCLRGLPDGRHADLENRIGPLNVTLYKGEAIEQEFAVEFTDYHYVAFRQSVK